MDTLLVANRGEIALRIFRTAKRMGLRCVAVHSEADRDAPFVRAADEAVEIGPAPASESYLRIDRVIDAARSKGARLIHPGYGFLAENPDLAQACEDAGLTFVGPPPDVLRAMGDKAEAKRLAAEAGVPVLDGYAGDDQSDEAFAKAAADIGYPVIAKAAAGGGGKGMTVVHDPPHLAEALAAARRIARAAFGDDRMLLERYVPEPRHVEVQILADSHGSVVHLGERDCSLQRRHQKILEESPSPSIDPAMRERLCSSAVALARHVGYVGAGTVEFLVGADGTAGFIECNARLQVEHPVTELVTGLDLVELQLRVASGEELPISQDHVRPRGHAVEVRVYAEDPSAGWLPQAGRIVHLRWPERARVDTGIEEGSVVTTHYDPMVAKVVTHGPDRSTALDELSRALDETQVLGVRTNVGFLRDVLTDPVVRDGRITTSWLEDAYPAWAPRPDSVTDSLAVAAAAEADGSLRPGSHDPWTSAGPWRVAGRTPIRVVVRPEGEERVVEVAGPGPFEVLGRTVTRTGGGWHVDGRPAAAVRVQDTWLVWTGTQLEVPVGLGPRRVEAAGAAHLGAPMPGQVIAIPVSPGDAVTSGQPLVVVEAMKMEHAITAPADGTVTAVLCRPGDQVDRGQALVDFEPA